MPSSKIIRTAVTSRSSVNCRRARFTLFRGASIFASYPPLVGCPREWIKLTALTTEERTELAALRKELRVVKMERDILGKAVAFFAKENA